VAVLLEVGNLEEVEGFQGIDPAVTGRRWRYDLVATVGGAGRLGPDDLVGGHVLHADPPALALYSRHKTFGPGADVHVIGTLSGHCPQRGGQLGLAEEITFLVEFALLLGKDLGRLG